MRVTTTGLTELERAIAHEITDTRPAATRSVARQAEDTAERMRSNAPVATGALRNSISVDGGGLDAEIGPTVAYAGFVEFGTSKMAPRPFVFQSVDEAAFERDIADNVDL